MHSLLALLRRRRIALAGLATALLTYTLAGFYLVPYLARSAMQDHFGASGRQLSIGELQFNPWRFELRASDLRLREADGAPLLAFRSLRLNAEPALSLWRRAIELRELSLVGPDVALLIEADGSVNLAKLAPPSDRKTEPGPPPRLRIGRLAVEDGRLGLEDRSRREPFKVVLAPIRFALNDFSTDLNHENAYRFAGKTAADERIEWFGTFTVQPLGSAGRFALRGLRAQTLDDYLQEQLPLKLASGSADLDGSYRLTLDRRLGLDIELPAIALSDLALAERGADTRPSVTVAKLGIQDLKLSLAKRELGIRRIEIDGAQIDVRRERDGRLNLSRLAAGRPAKATPVEAKTEPTTPPAAAAEKPAAWRVGVEEIHIANAAVRAEDRKTTPAVRLNLTPIRATIRGAGSELKNPLQIEADIGIDRGGRMQLQGSLQPQPLSTELALTLDGFALPLVQPYLDPRVALKLQSGRLGAKGRLSYAAPQLKFGGDVRITDFAARDARRNEDLAKWRELRLDGIAYRQAPERLEIERIVLRAPYARVAIAPDRSINFASLGKTSSTAAQPAAAAGGKPPPKMPIRIGTVLIDNGVANFSDQSIQPPFSAGIVGLGGSVLGLSTAEGSRAKVKLEGKVDKYAPVSIGGELNLLAATKYTDLKLSFRNMELTSFNPYSGKFAGYNIVKGKLTTELSYRIDDRKLEAEHHVVVDNIEFGDATHSKEAVPLPIKLAVALLKDRRGIIDLQLPVRGSLDDPTFRVGPIVWQVFVNVLTKIVTSPFAALGSLFGGGEELAWVGFPAGSAQLAPAEADKLTQLAQALVERPQLKINVPLTLATDEDGRALARAALDARLAAATKPEGDAGERLRALEKLHRELAGKSAQYPPEVEAMEREARTPARIVHLEAALLPHLAPEQPALDALAKQRAEAVQTALLANPELSPERVFIVANQAGSLVDGVVRMELKLE